MSNIPLFVNWTHGMPALTALRNQLTVKPSETSIPVNDERLLLAKAWLDFDPGAQSVFLIWEGANAVRLYHVRRIAWADRQTLQRQMSLLAVTVGVLSALLTLLSSHYTYHAHAQSILRALLSQQWSGQLNTYLAGQHTELILVALKLYNSMSTFAGGRERRAVMEAFAWETKVCRFSLSLSASSSSFGSVVAKASPYETKSEGR